jgi:NADP-dependent 3-hydroxy acid dehydrogenase YdfG
MMAKKSGTIVNIASYAAYFAFAGIAAYTASKYKLSASKSRMPRSRMSR